MWLKLRSEPEQPRNPPKRWTERSLWWWIGAIAAVYLAIVVTAIVVNAVFPAPRRVGIAGPGCVLESGLVIYHSCKEFPGAMAVEIFRNLPSISWLIPAFALAGAPFPMLYTASFIAVLVAVAWGLRAVVRGIERRRQPPQNSH